jgi:hypothetical protein
LLLLDVVRATHLTASELLSLVLHDDLSKQVVFLFLASSLRGGVLACRAVRVVPSLTALDIRIQILEVDFVVVLVLKGMQATVGSLFEQELRQVRRRNEVVVAASAVLCVVGPLLNDSKGVVTTVDLVGLHEGLLADMVLAAMHLAGVRLLHVSSILVRALRVVPLSGVAEVVTHLASLHADF